MVEGGKKLFGLIEKSGVDYGVFYFLEIYELKTMDRPFKEFKFGAIDWMSDRFEKKLLLEILRTLNLREQIHGNMKLKCLKIMV